MQDVSRTHRAFNRTLPLAPDGSCALRALEFGVSTFLAVLSHSLFHCLIHFPLPSFLPFSAVMGNGSSALHSSLWLEVLVKQQSFLSCCFRIG